MRPSFAFNNHGNCGTCNAESGRDFSMDHTGSGKHTNFTHVVYRNPSLRVFGSKGVTIPANHIAYVFSLTANNQMVGVDATGIIANVANYCAGRYRAMMQFVTEAVSKYIAGAFVTFAANVHRAVSVMTLCSSPQPTVIWRSLNNVLPEPFCDWTSYLQTVVVTRSEVAFRCFDNSSAPTGTMNRARKRVSPHVVAVYVLSRLTPDVTVKCAVSWRNFGFLSTTTVAITIRNFVRGAFSGIFAHVVSPPKAIGHATGRSLRRGGAFI